MVKITKLLVYKSIIIKIIIIIQDTLDSVGIKAKMFSYSRESPPSEMNKKYMNMNHVCICTCVYVT